MSEGPSSGPRVAKQGRKQKAINNSDTAILSLLNDPGDSDSDDIDIEVLNGILSWWNDDALENTEMYEEWREGPGRAIDQHTNFDEPGAMQDDGPEDR